ncbi:MAG TPA: alpha/beta hydrolase [Tepidisphaeraceae bacterium]
MSDPAVSPLRSRLRQSAQRLGAAVAALYAVGCSGLYFGQDRILFPGHDTQGTADADAWPNNGTQRVDLTAADGTKVVARYRPATGTKPGAPTVLFFYGNAMCAAWCDGIIEMLNDLGCNVLVPDYIGYGQSDGKPSEANCYATADAAWQYLRQRPDIAADRIVVMGWSLGAGVGIDLAAREPAAGLITLSAFTRVSDVARQHYPFVPVRLFVRSKFDNLTKATRINCPTLIVHGRRDTLIDPDMGQRLHDAIAGSEIVWLASADHNTMFDAEPRTLVTAIRRLLERRVPATRPATQPFRG